MYVCARGFDVLRQPFIRRALIPFSLSHLHHHTATLPRKLNKPAKDYVPRLWTDVGLVAPDAVVARFEAILDAAESEAAMGGSEQLKEILSARF